MTPHEDEIDLRPYLLLLLRHWWLILIFSVVLAGAGLAYGLVQPHVYKSTATILVTRSRTTLELADQFPTVSEPIDSKSKLQAILAIAQSDAITHATFDALKDSYPAGTTVEQFKEYVEITSNGDAIEVVATAKDPALAAEIANTWAREATNAINVAYGRGRATVEIQDQLSVAEENYRKAQAELESFITNNRVELLRQQIAEARRLLRNLSEQRTWQIEYHNERIRLMEQVIIQAEALKQQLLSNSQSSAGELGDSLAVLIARAETFGIRLNKTFVPNITPDNTITSGILNSPQAYDPRFNLFIDSLNTQGSSAQDYASDVDALITMAQTEKARSEDALEALSGEIIAGQSNETIEQTAERIRSLETLVEKDEALRKELTQKRDLAWVAFNTLLEKETEIQNAANSSNEVSFASPAVVPQTPESRHIARNTLIAGVLGAILAVVLVLGLEWWRKAGANQSLSTPAVAKSASTEH